MSSLMDVYEAGDMFAVKSDSGKVSVWKVTPEGGFSLVSDRPQVVNSGPQVGSFGGRPMPDRPQA